MMLGRLAGIVHGGVRVFRAEGELLIERARRVGLWSGIAFGGAVLAAVALLGLVTAGTAALALVAGWIVALASVSLLLLIGGLVTLVAAKRGMKESVQRRSLPPQPRLRSADGARQIEGKPMAERTHVHHHPHHDPVGGIPPGPSLGAAAGPTPRQQDRDWQDRAVTFVKKNPAIVAGGALAVLALLGPGRTLRMASKGMMLAGMAAGAFKQMQDQNGSKSHADASLGRGEPVSHH